MIIYHNPRCGTSRKTLAIIEEAGVKPEIRLYLKDALSSKELKETLKKLGMSADDILRKKEQIFKDEYKGKDLSESEWIDAMIEHPKLMERPIVIKGDKAILGRPPENVKELL